MSVYRTIDPQVSFGSKLYIQILGIPMGTNMFLFCDEREFTRSLSKEKRDDMIDALNSTSRYLDDLINIDIEQMSTKYIPLNLTKIMLLIPKKPV